MWPSRSSLAPSYWLVPEPRTYGCSKESPLRRWMEPVLSVLWSRWRCRRGTHAVKRKAATSSPAPSGGTVGHTLQQFDFGTHLPAERYGNRWQDDRHIHNYNLYRLEHKDRHGLRNKGNNADCKPHGHTMTAVKERPLQTRASLPHADNRQQARPYRSSA